MRPRVILPDRRPGSTSRIVLMGIAKPMPMLPAPPIIAAVAVDRGVHADHFAAQVQQRSARVAGIDRRVGLQHVGAALFGDRERTRLWR